MSIVPEEYLQSDGKILLKSAIDNPMEAMLVSVPLSFRTEQVVISYIQVHVAVMEELREEAFVAPKVFSWIKKNT